MLLTTNYATGPDKNLIKKSLPDTSFEKSNKKFENDMQKVLFATDKTRKTDFYLKGNPESLIATNVPSFMGGRFNPWVCANQGDMMLTGQEQ